LAIKKLLKNKGLSGRVFSEKIFRIKRREDVTNSFNLTAILEDVAQVGKLRSGFDWQRFYTFIARKFFYFAQSKFPADFADCRRRLFQNDKPAASAKSAGSKICKKCALFLPAFASRSPQRFWPKT
jgi:hypothetical protein